MPSHKKRTVLFICTHNSARSQMAEAILRHFYGDLYEAASAGTKATGIHPAARQVIEEWGISTAALRSKSIQEFQESQFDIVVTVCNHAREACPCFPGNIIIHKGFLDPAQGLGNDAEEIERFRAIRNEIYSWIKDNFSPGDNKGVGLCFSKKFCH